MIIKYKSILNVGIDVNLNFKIFDFYIKNYFSIHPLIFIASWGLRKIEF